MTDTASRTDETLDHELLQLGVVDHAARATLFYDARSVNSFSDVPVTDEELRTIWDLARWPPTAANTQPLRVLYVRSAEAKERLVGHLSEGNKIKTASAPAVAVLAVDLDFHEHIPTLFPARPEMKDHFGGDEDLRHNHARFNATLQVGYFLLAVRAVGLAAGPMAGFDKEGVDQEFFPDGRLRSLLVVNIGHPGANPWFGRLPRLDTATAVQWA